MGTIIVLNLMGGVALLLWGLHMVQSGILRTKDLYTGDQRVVTYGYCVSKLPHAGRQQQQVAGR